MIYLDATPLALIPAIRNSYGVTEHSNTFGIDYGKVTGIVQSSKSASVAVMTYAEYLATMTVKTLRSIAARMGIKGQFLKARKADLITYMVDLINFDAGEAYEIEAAPTMDKVRTLMTKAIEANRSVAQSAYRVWLDTDDESAYQLYLDADLMARTTQRAFHHGYPGVM